MMKILRIDASGRHGGSITRELGDEVVRRLCANHPGAAVQTRDLSGGLPLLDEDWIAANLSAPEDRTPAQHDTLAFSDSLVGELQSADALVVTVPLYNFGVPAAMKAWIDLVCRARLTFAYTPEGPRGLLADRPVYLVMASGGVPLGSPMDFASGYLRQVFGFIGIRDVHLIAADRMNLDAAAGLARARRAIADCLDRAVA